MGRTAGPGCGFVDLPSKSSLPHAAGGSNQSGRDLQTLTPPCPSGAEPADHSTRLLNSVWDPFSFPALEQPQVSLTPPETQTRKQLDDVFGEAWP